MDKQFKERLTRRSVWLRALYMVLFAIAYAVAELLVTVVVVVQFFFVLFSGSANEPLLRFGNNLSVYIYRLLRFQTFKTESRPFPFADWPDEKVGDNVWLQEPPALESQSGSSAGDDGDEK